MARISAGSDVLPYKLIPHKIKTELKVIPQKQVSIRCHEYITMAHSNVKIPCIKDINSLFSKTRYYYPKFCNLQNKCDPSIFNNPMSSFLSRMMFGIQPRSFR